MLRLISVVVLAAMVAACGGKSPRVDSGFLTQQYYDELSEIKTPSDHILYRYVSPSFQPSQYKRVIVEPVTAYPKPQPTEQVSRETLETLQLQLTMLLEDAVADVLALTREPGPGVLRIEMAITGINISDRPIEGYEYIPIALIAAGTQKAAGARSQRVKLFLEGRATDSITDEVLAVSVRELTGEDLEDAKAKLEVQRLNPGMEVAGKEWLAAFKSFFTDQ